MSSGTLEFRLSEAPLHTGLYKASIWFGERARNHVVIPDAIVFNFLAPEPVPAGVGLETIGFTRVRGRFSVHAPRDN